MVNLYLDTRSGLNWSGWFLSFKYMCIVDIYMITKKKLLNSVLHQYR